MADFIEMLRTYNFSSLFKPKVHFPCYSKKAFLNSIIKNNQLDIS